MKAETYIERNKIKLIISSLEREAWAMNVATIVMMVVTILSITTMDLGLFTLSFAVTFLPVICHGIIKEKIEKLEEKIFQLRLK